MKSLVFLTLLFVWSAFAQDTILGKLNEVSEKIAAGTNDPALEIQALELAAQYFASMGVKVLRTTRGDNSVLEIEQTGESPLNKVAKGIFEKLGGVKIVYSPKLLQTGANATFVRKGAIYIAKNLDQIVSLKDYSFFHEIRHTLLTYLLFERGLSSLFDINIAKTNVSLSELLTNPYAKMVSLQELSTHAYQIQLIFNDIQKGNGSQISFMEYTMRASSIAKSILSSINTIRKAAPAQLKISFEEDVVFGVKRKIFEITDGNVEIYIPEAALKNISEENLNTAILERLSRYESEVKGYSELADNLLNQQGDKRTIAKDVKALNQYAKSLTPNSLQKCEIELESLVPHDH